MIDLRSDTVTQPTEAMRQAMAHAVVGDDVYGEDPTVNQLEALAAAISGKEQGLFVSSGTMGNLVSILAHAGRGDEAIVGVASHSYNSEAGGMATLGGVTPRVLDQDDWGRMSLQAIEANIRPDNEHYPRSRLILLETTAGSRWGAPLPLDYMAAVREIADRHHLALHLDGARLFNAATALDVEPVDITQHVDSVTFCLSKGLSAPVGSLVCGSADFIALARRVRKAVGGGMRQAGILAAAGIVALQETRHDLAADHRRARRLAQQLATIAAIEIDVDKVHSNMLFFRLSADYPQSAYEVATTLRERHGVLIGARGPRDFRALTHRWIDDRAIDVVVESLRSVLEQATAYYKVHAVTPTSGLPQSE